MPVLERSGKERRVRGFCQLCDHNFTYVATDPFTPESDRGGGDGCPVSCSASLPGRLLSFLLCSAPVTPRSPNPSRVAAGVWTFSHHENKGCTRTWSLNTKGAQQQQAHKLCSGEGFVGAAEAAARAGARKEKPWVPTRPGAALPDANLRRHLHCPPRGPSPPRQRPGTGCLPSVLLPISYVPAALALPVSFVKTE